MMKADEYYKEAERRREYIEKSKGFSQVVFIEMYVAYQQAYQEQAKEIEKWKDGSGLQEYVEVRESHHELELEKKDKEIKGLKSKLQSIEKIVREFNNFLASMGLCWLCGNGDLNTAAEWEKRIVKFLKESENLLSKES